MEVQKSAMTACENFIYRREEKTEAISRSFLSIRSVVDHNLRSSFVWQIKQNAIYFNKANEAQNPYLKNLLNTGKIAIHSLQLAL